MNGDPFEKNVAEMRPRELAGLAKWMERLDSDVSKGSGGLLEADFMWLVDDLAENEYYACTYTDTTETLSNVVTMDTINGYPLHEEILEQMKEYYDNEIQAYAVWENLRDMSESESARLERLKGALREADLGRQKIEESLAKQELFLANASGTQENPLVPRKEKLREEIDKTKALLKWKKDDISNYMKDTETGQKVLVELLEKEEAAEQKLKTAATESDKTRDDEIEYNKQAALDDLRRVIPPPVEVSGFFCPL